MDVSPSTGLEPVAASTLSGHLDTRTAATEVAFGLHDALGGTCDLVFLFATFHHRAALPEAAETLRRTLSPGTLLAVTTEAVVGNEAELEGVAGMSAIAMRLPGVRLWPWMTTPDDPLKLRRPELVAQRLGVTDDHRVTFMIGEPFTSPVTRLLPAIDACAPGPVPVVGGMASGASQPGHNVLVLDDRVTAAGAIGVTLSGDVDVDVVLSQGCRPIGQPWVITKASSNLVLELGGRPALEVLQETTGGLSDRERPLLEKGVLLGHVIDEQKRPFGRGDFLVRSLLGFDRERNGILVGDLPRLGQTVQFHVRDAVTAAEDLQLLLDAQVMKPDPFGALLFTCNGRGKRLFGVPNHDVDMINKRIGPVATAGFFAAGEIGPVGAKSFLHGHTAALAILRARGAPAGE